MLRVSSFYAQKKSSRAGKSSNLLLEEDFNSGSGSEAQDLLFDDSIDIRFRSKFSKLFFACQLRVSFDNGLNVGSGRRFFRAPVMSCNCMVI